MAQPEPTPGGPLSASGDRRAAPPVDLNVINYQVGALQTALDRGLGALERVIEKGFDNIDRRLSRIEERQASMEKRQERSDARLDALEEFRREQESAEKDVAILQRAELKLATDGSETARIWRTIAIITVGSLAALGTAITILAQLGVFQ